MAEIIGSILVLLGALFHFSAGLGMLRMPDAYTRMQAGTKASTLGNTLWSGHCLLSSRLDAETLDRHLFRADDQPDLLARAGACRPPDQGPNGTRRQPSTHYAMPESIARRRMIRRVRIILAVALFGLVFASLTVNHVEHQSLPPLGKRYVELVPQDLGAPNVITGILLTYRAFDTLGEVAVLFMVAAGVGLVLGTRTAQQKPAGRAQTSAGQRDRADRRANSRAVDRDFRGLYHHERSPVRRRRLPGRGGDCVERCCFCCLLIRGSGSISNSSAAPSRPQACCSCLSALQD